MYCSKCGEKNEKDDIYCKKCGNLLNDYSNLSSSESEEDKKSKKDAETSKTLGIISVVLSFFISILALPIAITGLVFGIKGKKNGKAGIILNIISIILCIGLGILSFFSIILFIGILGALFDEMFDYDSYYENTNYTGAYQCEMINPVFDQEENTKNLSLRLYKDDTFTLNLYEEKQNINIDGEYELYDSNYDYDKDSFQYDLKLTSDFQYINNEKIRDNYKEYFLLEEENNEITLTNETSNIQYSCTKIK